MTAAQAQQALTSRGIAVTARVTERNGEKSLVIEKAKAV
jgi:hypothetical protein